MRVCWTPGVGGFAVTLEHSGRQLECCIVFGDAKNGFLRLNEILVGPLSLGVFSVWHCLVSKYGWKICDRMD